MQRMPGRLAFSPIVRLSLFGAALNRRGRIRDDTMLGGLAKKIFGSSNERRLKSYRPKVAAINALEAEVSALSDEGLAARTIAFRQQLAEGASVDDLLVPAFATVREAAKRVLAPAAFRRPAHRRHGAA